MDKITEITKLNEELETESLPNNKMTEREQIEFLRFLQQSDENKKKAKTETAATVTACNVAPTPKRTKIAIVGFASNWNLAPFDDQSWEIWGLNELYMLLKSRPGARAERWFEIHDPFKPSKNKPEHHAALKQFQIPVYMIKHYNEFPSSVQYPLEEVIDFVHDKGLRLTLPNGEERKNPYGTSSIAWMFLLAWMEGFKEISIYGVDLAQKDEYLRQRPCLEYYIGAAQMDGIKVIMPETCDLLKSGLLYGFETDTHPMVQKMRARKDELKGRKKQIMSEINKAQAAIQQHTASVNALDGSLADIDFWIDNYRY